MAEAFDYRKVKPNSLNRTERPATISGCRPPGHYSRARPLHSSLLARPLSRWRGRPAGYLLGSAAPSGPLHASPYLPREISMKTFFFFLFRSPRFLKRSPLPVAPYLFFSPPPWNVIRSCRADGIRITIANLFGPIPMSYSLWIAF